MKQSDRVFYYINQRCNNKNKQGYKNYGGRGIKNLITKQELEYLWVRDKGYLMKKPTIDRIDNDGDYILSNCRFLENSENVSRSIKRPSHCPQGHPYSGDNLKICKLNLRPRGNRICRICDRVSKIKWQVANQCRRNAAQRVRRLKAKAVLEKIKHDRPT